MKNWKNVILGICAVGLLFVCWRSIVDTQEFDAKVVERENVVKKRLMHIKSAEEAYKSQHEEYCGDWNVLIAFVKDGKLPIVMKQGVLTEEQMDKGLTESKAAAIVNSGDQAAIAANGLEGFRRDTVWVSLLDSLNKEFDDFCPDSLRYIPFSQGDTFEIIACPNTTRSGSIIQVMECNAPDSSFLKGMGKAGSRLIYNRNEEANAKGAYPGLKIGDAGNNWNNNAGNWE